MERAEIERLLGNDPSVVKIPGFTKQEVTNAINKAFKRATAQGNIDRSFKEQINRFWWIALCSNGATPTITVALERWMEKPDFKHLKMAISLVPEIAMPTDEVLKTILSYAEQTRVKNGYPCWSVTAMYTIKRY